MTQSDKRGPTPQSDVRRWQLLRGMGRVAVWDFWRKLPQDAPAWSVFTELTKDIGSAAFADQYGPRPAFSTESEWAQVRELLSIWPSSLPEALALLTRKVLLEIRCKDGTLIGLVFSTSGVDPEVLGPNPHGVFLLLTANVMLSTTPPRGTTWSPQPTLLLPPSFGAYPVMFCPRCNTGRLPDEGTLEQELAHLTRGRRVVTA
jgi:hypothetical protein